MNKYFVRYENDVDEYGNSGASMTATIPIDELSESVQDSLYEYDLYLNHKISSDDYDAALAKFADIVIHDDNVILYAFVADEEYLIDDSDIVEDYIIDDFYIDDFYIDESEGYLDHIDEDLQYIDLKSDILKQAKAIGIKPIQLVFPEL